MRPICGLSSCAARLRIDGCARSAARRFARIWATWIAESLVEGFRPRLLVNPPPPPSFGAQQAPAAPAPSSILASPGLRVVGGLIDLVILAALFGVVEAVTNRNHGVASLVDLAVALGYFGYFWSSRGQTIGMMVFGFRVRDRLTGRFPSPFKAVLRGLVWWLEVWFTFCVVGLVAWLWMFWDAHRQAFHDKVAGTVVAQG